MESYELKSGKTETILSDYRLQDVWPGHKMEGFYFAF